MVGSVFSIDLSNFVYENPSFSSNETINVSAPQQCSFLDTKNHPPGKGVYVIFSPAVTDYSNKGTDGNRQKTCIYVGEGNIKNRLYRHKYQSRFAEGIDYEVIYYKIEEQKDRKAVERILIKHYDPTFNKEGTSKVAQVGAHLSFGKQFQKAARELNERFEGVSFGSERTYDELFDFNVVVAKLLKDGFSFEDISFALTEHLNTSSYDKSSANEALASFCGFDEEEFVRDLLGLDQN